MANSQRKQVETPARVLGLSLTNGFLAGGARQMSIETTHNRGGYDVPILWAGWVIERHRHCCWEFLTKDTQRRVLEGIKAQREQDAEAFAAAIIHSNVAEMIAIMNTVTSKLRSSPPRLLHYWTALEKEAEGKIFDRPFQHPQKYTLYLLPGTEYIPEQFGQPGQQNSAGGIASINPAILDIEEPTTDSKGDAAKSKRKKKNKNRRGKTTAASTLGESLGRGTSSNNEPADAVDTDPVEKNVAPAEVVASKAQESAPPNGVADNNTSFTNLPFEPETAAEAPQISYNDNSNSSPGATRGNSPANVGDVDFRQGSHRRRPFNWPSTFTGTHTDFFLFPIDNSKPATHIEGPDNPRDKRTLYNYDADEILLGEHLEARQTSARPGFTFALDVTDYGNQQYGSGPQLPGWITCEIEAEHYIDGACWQEDEILMEMMRRRDA